MEFGLDFRKEFLDAYMAGRVTQVGLHSTKDPSNESSLRRGLKCKPSMFRVIKRELGVHWYVVVPRKEVRGMTREKAEREFDSFCRCFGCYDPDENQYLQELPGLVVLTENVPRSRFYSGRNPEGNIWNQRYVPVRRGLENAIHTLVLPENIFNVLFLSEEAAEIVLAEADRLYGSLAKIWYFGEIGKISQIKAGSLEKTRRDFINRNAGRLLLSKARNYLIKD